MAISQCQRVEAASEESRHADSREGFESPPIVLEVPQKVLHRKSRAAQDLAAPAAGDGRTRRFFIWVAALSSGAKQIAALSRLLSFKFLPSGPQQGEFVLRPELRVEGVLRQRDEFFSLLIGQLQDASCGSAIGEESLRPSPVSSPVRRPRKIGAAPIPVENWSRVTGSYT